MGSTTSHTYERLPPTPVPEPPARSNEVPAPPMGYRPPTLLVSWPGGSASTMLTDPQMDILEIARYANIFYVACLCPITDSEHPGSELYFNRHRPHWVRSRNFYSCTCVYPYRPHIRYDSYSFWT